MPRRRNDDELISPMRDPHDLTPGLAPAEAARLRGAIVNIELLEGRIGDRIGTMDLLDLYSARTATLVLMTDPDVMACLFTERQLDVIFPD